jgi:hypothetical protein
MLNEFILKSHLPILGKNINEKRFMFFPLSLLIVLSLYCLEVYLLTQHIDLIYLQAASPDEMLLYEIAVQQSNGWNFGAGYGPTFWLIMDVVTKNLNAPHAIATLKIIFVSLKYFGALFIACTVFKNDEFKKTFFLLVFVLTPGYLFFGKVISPEYLILFLVAISISFLYLGRKTISWKYYVGLIFMVLAFITKISVLPALVLIFFYALLVAFTTYRTKKAILTTVNLLIVVISTNLFFLIMSGFWNSINTIITALSIVPNTSINSNIFHLAYFRNELTWDQIKLGGIGIDFLSISLIFIISIILRLVYLYRINYNYKKMSFLILLVLVSLSSILLPTIRQVAFSWYLFFPIEILLVTAILMIPKTRLNYIIVFSFYCLILFFHDAKRGVENVEFYVEKNQELTSTKHYINALNDHLNEQKKCMLNGNLDILVPNINNDILVLPMRVSLNHVSREIWIEPDYLVINRNLEKNGTTPLLQHVIKDSISNYTYIRDFGTLGLYINNNPSCFKL